MDGYTILVGSNGAATILEVGIRDNVIFHAMEAREKFLGKGDWR